MSAEYLTVVDEVHTEAGKSLQEICDLLDEGIGEYIRILNTVTSEAAKEGHTTTRYQEYAGIVSGLKGQLAKLGNMLNTTANNFVADINAADGYLY